MSQLAIRFVLLNIYLFALFCPAGEAAVVRNHAKWPISESLLKTALFDFFSFKKTESVPNRPTKAANKNTKDDSVSATVSAKQKPLRTLLFWWPKTQQEVVTRHSPPQVVAASLTLATPALRSPLELFEILTI